MRGRVQVIHYNYFVILDSLNDLPNTLHGTISRPLTLRPRKVSRKRAIKNPFQGQSRKVLIKPDLQQKITSRPVSISNKSQVVYQIVPLRVSMDRRGRLGYHRLIACNQYANKVEGYNSLTQPNQRLTPQTGALGASRISSKHETLYHCVVSHIKPTIAQYAPSAAQKC